MSRKIILKGADNVRHFVGLKNREGRVIRNDQFIRSNSLSYLTPDDVNVLRQANLRRVIDLRTHTEVAEKPNVPIEGTTYYHIPLLDERAVGITHDRQSERQTDPDAVLYMPDMYAHIVTDKTSVAQLSRVFQLITSSQPGATLWHCAAGKDRCGIVSALFLFILDMAQDTILEDYLKTNEVAYGWADSYYREVLARTGDAELAGKYRNTVVADANYLLAAEQAIVAQWGSVKDFVTNQLGIRPDRIRQLQERTYGEL